MWSTNVKITEPVKEKPKYPYWGYWRDDRLPFEFKSPILCYERGFINLSALKENWHDDPPQLNLWSDPARLDEDDVEPYPLGTIIEIKVE